LFEINIPPLQIQKYQRELEIIVQECILITIRESIPVETILKAYMDETIEEDIVEEVKEEIIPNENIPQENISVDKSALEKNNDLTSNNRLSFNDVDMALDTDNQQHIIDAPKNIERLEEISETRNQQRKLETEEDENENIKLKITDQSADLNNLDIHVIEPPELNLLPDLLIDDIEVLD
jgi:hypothetical protein